MELLVVVSIIAVLLAVLLPTLSVARQRAMCVACLSNLRQLGTAAQEYTQAYAGSFPPAYYGAGWHDAWDFKLIAGPAGTTAVIPGILWMGETNLRIQQCPAYHGRSGTATDPFTGYNYNTSYIGHGADELHPASANVNQLVRPAACALFGDGGFGALTNKYMRAPLLLNPVPPNGDGVPDAERAAGAQAYRHEGNTNVCYCDGHVESVSTRFDATGPTVITLPAADGFLSADNSAYDGY